MHLIGAKRVGLTLGERSTGGEVRGGEGGGSEGGGGGMQRVEGGRVLASEDLHSCDSEGLTQGLAQQQTS